LNNTSPKGPSPKDTRNITFSFVADPPADATPNGLAFGTVNVQPHSSYTVGEIVVVQFWCASPRNDPYQDATYLTIEQVLGTQVTIVMDDSAWETKYHWERVQKDQSLCTIEWDTNNSKPGTYQIRTFGSSKDANKNLTPFQGVTNTFSLN